MRLVKFISFFVILTSCCVNTKEEQHNSINTVPDTFRNFFTKEIAYGRIYPCELPFEIISDSLKKINGYTELYVPFYSVYMYALECEPLFDTIVKDSIYRLIGLRTFDKPISIELRKNKTVFIKVKITDGKCGYFTGNVETKIEKIVSDSIWTEFEKLLIDCNYWEMSFFDNDVQSIDGSNWLLEARINSKYQIVQKDSPFNKRHQTTDKGKFSNACKYLIDQVKIDSIIIY